MALILDQRQGEPEKDDVTGLLRRLIGTAVIVNDEAANDLLAKGHIHQGPEDLMKKQEMTRVLTRKTGFCIQRCMGVDAMNALSVVTKEMDDRLGTEYHQRFLEYLRYWQEKDITGCCAQTDAKGHRKLRPHQQPDPDAYLRVVKKDAKGIVVRGAKRHITVGSYAEEIIVLPTRVMTPEEKDWAVAFAVPGDAPGLYLVNRASAPRPRKHLKAPLADFGSSDTLTIFQDVLSPGKGSSCAERRSSRGTWPSSSPSSTGTATRGASPPSPMSSWASPPWWPSTTA